MKPITTTSTSTGTNPGSVTLQTDLKENCFLAVRKPAQPSISPAEMKTNLTIAEQNESEPRGQQPKETSKTAVRKINPAAISPVKNMNTRQQPNAEATDKPDRGETTMNTNDQQHDLSTKLNVVSFPPPVLARMRPENLASVKRQARRNPHSWGCWNQLGMALESVGDWPSAVHAYCRATALHNDHAGLFFRLGVVAEQTGELELAVVAFDDATKTNPDYCEAWLKLGELSARQGFWLDAVLAFEKAVALQPGDAVALFNLGVAYIATNDVTAASNLSQQLADLDKAAALRLWALMGKDTLMEAAA